MIETDVAVEFTAIQIDQCYQLKSGITNKVSVQYDPTWGNFIEPSKFIEFVGDFLKDLKSWSQTYSSNPNSAESKESAAELYELALLQQQSFEEDIALSSEERAEVLALFKPVVDGLFAVKNGTSNQRIASGCAPNCISETAENSYTLYFSFLNKVFQFSVTPFCEKNPDGSDSDKCGIVPKGWWENSSTGHAAFFAGIVDGAYLTLKDVGATVYSISDIIGCTVSLKFVNDPKCVETLDKALGMVQTVAAIYNNPSLLADAFKQQYNEFIEHTSGFSNVNKYYHGKAVFDVAVMAIGLGEASAILKSMNAIKLAAMLKRADALAQKINIINRMLNKVGLTTRKIGANTLEIIKRGPAGSVIKTFGKYTANLFQGVKEKTADFKKKIGVYHSVDYEIVTPNGTIKKGKGDVEIYVKETTTNSNVADDIAVSAIPKNWKSALQMREELDKWVGIKRASLTSNNQLRDFSVATVVYDVERGKWFFGANGGIPKDNVKIHEILKEKLPEISIWSKDANCAECDAVNNALWNGAKWENLQMHTVKVTDWRTGKIADKIRCDDCKDIIFPDIFVTSEQ